MQNFYYFLFKCLVELTHETIWIWRFIFQKVLNYEFNFYNNCKAMQLSISFWVSFPGLWFPKNCSISSKLSPLLAQSCSWKILCCAQSLSHVQLFAIPWSVAHQSPLSIKILQVRILEWVACPPPGDLPNPGIKPRSPAFQANSLPAEPPWRPKSQLTIEIYQFY